MGAPDSDLAVGDAATVAKAVQALPHTILYYEPSAVAPAVQHCAGHVQNAAQLHFEPLAVAPAVQNCVVHSQVVAQLRPKSRGCPTQGAIVVDAATKNRHYTRQAVY